VTPQNPLGGVQVEVISRQAPGSGGPALAWRGAALGMRRIRPSAAMQLVSGGAGTWSIPGRAACTAGLFARNRFAGPGWRRWAARAVRLGDSRRGAPGARPPRPSPPGSAARRGALRRCGCGPRGIRALCSCVPQIGSLIFDA